MTDLKRLEPLQITMDSGETVWLGAESDVWEAVRAEWGTDVTGIEADGWMVDVGWDRFNYERKRDFVGETGFLGWWEGCGGPADGKETRKLRRAWRLIWAASGGVG